MNFISIIVDAIIKAISYIVSAIVYVGKPVLVSLYNNFVSKYLLSPQYAFPSIVNGSIGEGVKSLYYFIMFNIYDPVLTIILIALGVLILLNSSIQLGFDFRNIWIKLLLLLVLSNISFFLFQDFLYIGSLLYSQLWNYGIPTHNFSSGSNVLAGLQVGGSAGSIVSLLILVIFIFLMLYLLLFLSMRAAIVYTFPILAPIFTLLLLIPRTKEVGERIWFLFIDSLVAPMLMAVPLILSTYVKNDSVLVLGFLALADAAPTMLAFSQSSRAATSFLGRSVGRGVSSSMSYINKNMKGAETIVKSISTPSEAGGAKGTPEIGSIRQFSPLNSSTNANSSMFFKVK
ncbi:MAG: hypothetical protein M1556_07705 [Candidatus Thermoplasmatota archaeon]|jgi:hypothetical protein|nr:hypothetical protein [Candidatus Thermoplasmatota archaeon]